MTDDLLVRVPAWSGLRTLGQSPVMKLTILVPFIGALILFNAQLVELLKMTPMGFFAKPGAEPEIPVWRLAATYFGLLALGCASFLFTVRCPADLKEASSLTEFANKEAQLTTAARASYLAMEVVANFRLNRRRYDDSSVEAGRSWRPAYPDEHERHFYLFSNRVAGDLFGSETGPNYDGDLFDRKGDVLIDAFADRFVSCVGAARALPTMLGETAMETPMDLYTLRYTDMDYSRPHSRASIAALYVGGFGLLAIPSLVTVLAVIRFLIGF